MAEMNEVREQRSVLSRGVRPGIVPGKPGLKNFRFPQRRAKEPTKAEQAETRRKIEEFIATRGVTVCKPGFAVGVVPTQYDF